MPASERLSAPPAVDKLRVACTRARAQKAVKQRSAQPHTHAHRHAHVHMQARADVIYVYICIYIYMLYIIFIYLYTPAHAFIGICVYIYHISIEMCTQRERERLTEGSPTYTLVKPRTLQQERPKDARCGNGCCFILSCARGLKQELISHQEEPGHTISLHHALWVGKLLRVHGERTGLDFTSHLTAVGKPLSCVTSGDHVSTPPINETAKKAVFQQRTSKPAREGVCVHAFSLSPEEEEAQEEKKKRRKRECVTHRPVPAPALAHAHTHTHMYSSCTRTHLHTRM